MKYLLKLIFSLFLFLFVDILYIDSNSHLRLRYDENNLYEEGYYKIYFKDMNIYEFKNILDTFDLNIVSLKPKYSESLYIKGSSSTTIINNLIEEISEENVELTNIIENFRIESIEVICEVKDLIDLEKLVDVY